MERSIESLRVEFLRILDEIEKVTKVEKEYEPSKYESCIKIDGKPILPPLMTKEKKEMCAQWKSEAIKLEEKLAEKQKATIVQAVQDRFALSEEKVDPDSIQTSEDPCINESGAASLEGSGQRERRLSYTLDEPSPVLLAYMERFGQTSTAQTENVEMNEDDQSDDTACHNPQCVLEDYLIDISQPPKLPSKEIPEKLPKETMSPNKENVPPISNQEWSKEETELPSPLKNDTPSWARSPKILIDANANQHESLNRFKTSCSPTSMMEQEKLTKTRTIEINNDNEPDEIGLSSIVTVNSSLLESETLPTVTNKNISNITSTDTVTNHEYSKTSAKEKIGAAVTALAMDQKKEIEKLVAQQAKEREQLRSLFEEQQRQLMASVVNAVSSTSDQDQDHSHRTDSNSNSTLTVVNNNQNSNRTHSPVIPTVKPQFEPSSWTLPPDYHLPEATKTPEYNVRFEKLSALIKGHLVRRLMKTDKVQGIIASMQDITNIALQLQSENRHIPNPSEDQQLLERLHLQRHREGRNFHEIFFKHTPQQRMAIISYDREIQAQRRFRDSLLNSPGSRQQQPRHKRISAVTMAKIQQKQQIQALLTSAGSPQWKKLRHPVQAKISSRTSYRGTTKRSLNFDGPSTASSIRSSSSMSAL